MKINKIIYWTSTGIVSLMMAYSTYAYLTQDVIKQGFQHLGFPGYFRVELGLAKLVGALLLLLPVATRVKEWAYAGFAFTFVSAFIAHTASGDPISNRMGPLIFLIILIGSYISYYKLSKKV